jgi:hypothetical protein
MKMVWGDRLVELLEVRFGSKLDNRCTKELVRWRYRMKDERRRSRQKIYSMVSDTRRSHT